MTSKTDFGKEKTVIIHILLITNTRQLILEWIDIPIDSFKECFIPDTFVTKLKCRILVQILTFSGRLALLPIPRRSGPPHHTLRAWMSTNKLKMNDSKTTVISITSCKRTKIWSFITFTFFWDELLFLVQTGINTASWISHQYRL